MGNLTYKDIISRQRNLLSDTSQKSNINVNQMYDSLKENYSYQKAKLILENWTAFGNEDIAFNKVMEVFTIITDNDSDSNIMNASNIIESNIIPKLRNAKQTNMLNHYKRGWIKHRHTSMLNDTKDNENAVAKAKANGGYLGNSLHPKRKYKRDIYGRKIGEVKNSSETSDEQQNEEQENVKECFDRFIHVAYVNEQCDRVLSNHQKLTKRFNLDNVVRKCPLNYQSLQECIFNICNLLETYDMPEGARYLISLENTMYLMNKNCVPVDNSFIVETVTDYFLMNENENIDNTVRNIKYVIENSKFFNEEELSGIKYLCIDEQSVIDDLENEDDISPVEENKIHDMFLNYKKKRTNTIKKQQKLDSLKIKKVIHDFKKSNKKNIESFKAAISRIFVNSPEGIINELPDIFAFVRLGIALGSFAINPILGVITTITGYFLKMKVSRERMEIVVAQYTKERDNYKKKMDEATDEKKKEKYEKLYKQYKKDLTKLESYQDTLYTEAENDKRMEEKYAKEAEASGDDFDFDFDMDFDFEEQTAIDYTNMMAVLYEELSYSKANLMAAISNNISKVSNDDIYNITEAVKLCSDIVNCPRYINILEDELVRTRRVQKESYIPSLQRIDAIKICISDIDKIKYDSLLESSYIESDDNTIPDIKSLYESLNCKNNIINDTIEYLSEKSLNESKDEKSGMSFMSKLKIASENLKRFALKAKDKDKQLSMKLDSELNRTMKSAKKAMISDSRENIIKGSFLPSASKCIHIALASGAAFLISPVLAVIALIGYIGCSKSLTEKERNLILDDIDIEIKMCDKYMKIAEDKDDLSAVREIMKTKRDLERQRSRILYNKNYIFKGKKQYDMKPDSMIKKNNDD